MEISHEIKKKYDEAAAKRKNAFEVRRRKIRKDVGGVDDEIKRINKIWSDVLKGVRTAEAAEREADVCQKKIERLLAGAGYGKDALEYRPHCALCKDTGYIDGEPCTCLTQYCIAEIYKDSNIEQLIGAENFNTFDFALYSQAGVNGGSSPKENIIKVVEKARDFVQCFDTCSENLFIQGKVGVGKSFLAHCIAGEILQKGYSLIYITAFNLVEQLTAIALDKQDRTLFSLFTNAALLIIDDFGCERQTDYSEMQMLNIINERLINHKPVIISSNLTTSELNRRYDERIVSRILGNFSGLRIQGDDLRLKRACDRNRQE